MDKTKKILSFTGITALTLLILNLLKRGPKFSQEFFLQPQRTANDWEPDERFVDFLSEDEALMYPPCQNFQATQLTIQSDFIDGMEYKVGDKIYMTFTLFDGFGKPREGGDKMFVSVQNEQLGAYSAALVMDLKNGSYFAEIEVLWKGETKIIVWLYTLREEITCMYRLVRDMLSTRYPVAKYEGVHSEEEYICNVFPDKLLRLTNYTRLCNFTYINSGFPWFCGHPKRLMCEDWHYVTIREPADDEFPLSDCEKRIWRNSAQKADVTKNYAIYGAMTQGNVIRTSGIPCNRYDTKRLWYQQRPVGFFYNNKWRLKNCKLLAAKDIETCLRNKRLYIFGDSTTRQWFLDIAKRFKCKLVSELSNPKIHKPMKCDNNDLNYTAIWSAHSQPFCVGSTHYEPKSYLLHSIARRIDEMDPSEYSIILIHMFSHMVYHHQSVLEMKAKLIRKSVENLFIRNKNARVLIKMVHTHKKSDAYFGFPFTDIWYKVFHGLHDRVVFLDNKDATVATRNTELHPADFIVSAMVDQMFSYACN